MFKFFERYLDEYIDIEEYIKEFDKEVESNSDRGIVLICGSIIDVLLTDLLKSFLIKKDNIEKQLFITGQALGTFDGKIKMAFYLGLISKNEFQNLVYIQRIRNRFAHQVVDISFENDKIINICSEFNIPKNSFRPSFIPLYKKGSDEIPSTDLNPIKKDTPAKDRFIFTFKYIIFNLLNRIYGEDLGSRKEYNKDFKAHESLMLLPNNLLSMFDKAKRSYQEQKEKVEKQRNEVEKMKDDLVESEDDEKKRKLEEQTEEISDLLRDIDLNIQDIEERKSEFQEAYKVFQISAMVLENSMED